MVFHVLNRAAKQVRLFCNDWDYSAFESLLHEAKQRVAVSLFAYCIMPNHWHLVLRPDGEHDLSRFMHWLTVTHAQRLHAWAGTAGTGAVYQGRFKAVPVQCDRHFLTVCRYVERNPLRAGLVPAAEGWRWCSLWRRMTGSVTGALSPWPVARPADWPRLVNEPQTEAELNAIRDAVLRGAPFGDAIWRVNTAADRHLEPSLRRRGRPPKTVPGEKDSRPLF